MKSFPWAFCSSSCMPPNMLWFLRQFCFLPSLSLLCLLPHSYWESNQLGFCPNLKTPLYFATHSNNIIFKHMKTGHRIGWLKCYRNKKKMNEFSCLKISLIFSSENRNKCQNNLHSKFNAPFLKLTNLLYLSKN